MTTRILRIAVAILAASLSARAGAHDFQCTATFGLASADSNGSVLLGADGLPVVAAGAATTFVVDTYPAFVAFQVDLRNTVPETSVVTGAENSAAAALGGTVYGPEIAAGFSLPPDGATDQATVLSIPSYESCLALGGVPGTEGGDGTSGPVCGPGSFEARFAVTHDLGSAECRARLVCNPPREPTACTIPSWTGAIDVPNMIRGVVDSQGRVVLAGTDPLLVSSDPSGNRDRVLSIVGRAGDVTTLARWNSGPGTYSSAAFVREDRAGSFYVAGSVLLQPPPTASTYLGRLAPDGSRTWEIALGVVDVPGDGVLLDFELDDSGTSYVSMRPYSHHTASIAKVDATGALVWETNVPVRYTLLPLGVSATGVFTAYHLPELAYPTDDVNITFVKLDPATGNVVWTREYGTPDTDVEAGIAANSSGATLVGNTSSPTAHDGFAARFDEGGNVLWVRRFPGGSGTVDVVTDAADSAWVLGSTQDSSFVAHLDPAGNVLWTTSLPAGEFGTSISLDCAGNAFVVGWSDGGAREFVRRISSDGSL